MVNDRRSKCLFASMVTVLLSGHFLFFLYAFHAVIRLCRKYSGTSFGSIRYGLIPLVSNNDYSHKVLVRYRYRDSLSLSILSGFFDSE
ncbi:MAG: hypothetical protein BECKG1743E_GA0114224_109162 [Candidatus Kentron sp. G]|nr:MAG: hypothetical protein BECKG1743E_GA0114224_109162 [Candidatus Kentron sp. G]